MKTKIWAIFAIFFCTFLTALAQVFYKIGAQTLSYDITLFMNVYLIAGIGLYIFAGVGLIFILRFGDLSVLYPVVASSFIWVSLFSMYFFDEPMNLIKWGGILCIIIGISFIGYGGQK